MEDALNTFLQSIKDEQRLSEHTITNYEKDLRNALDFFKLQKVSRWSNIDESHIRSLIMARKSKQLSPKSLNRQLSSLRTFFQYLVHKNLIEDNKALKVSTLKTPRSLPKALDVDQISKLLDITPTDPLSTRDLAMVELLYSAGLRVSELVSLNLSDLDLEQNQLTVIGKGKKSRIGLIGRFAKNALQNWISTRQEIVYPNEDAVFVNRSGKRLTTRTVQSRLKKLGLQQELSNIHPHRIRHSFASHLLESSQDLRSVQELLGHENLQTTQIYTKVNFQHLAGVYDQCHPRAQRKKEDHDES